MTCPGTITLSTVLPDRLAEVPAEAHPAFHRVSLCFFAAARLVRGLRNDEDNLSRLDVPEYLGESEVLWSDDHGHRF
ncbi:hypothetical protein GCM10009687_56280 [Asanoa iriomotensis]|uniref:Uncharacterized protein n=1 Tax=Asanoa iriomotensis TaxID=234613 RepID=A0ABQ4CFT9_9ACTN|nr:hypothetical protein Air01nite_77420 [Asanoa iriomotensis]